MVTRITIPMTEHELCVLAGAANVNANGAADLSVDVDGTISVYIARTGTLRSIIHNKEAYSETTKRT